MVWIVNVHFEGNIVYHVPLGVEQRSLVDKLQTVAGVVAGSAGRRRVNPDPSRSQPGRAMGSPCKRISFSCDIDRGILKL
jgi:hypothetical protein